MQGLGDAQNLWNYEGSGTCGTCGGLCGGSGCCRGLAGACKASSTMQKWEGGRLLSSLFFWKLVVLWHLWRVVRGFRVLHGGCLQGPPARCRSGRAADFCPLCKLVVNSASAEAPAQGCNGGPGTCSGLRCASAVGGELPPLPFFRLVESAGCRDLVGGHIHPPVPPWGACWNLQFSAAAVLGFSITPVEDCGGVRAPGGVLQSGGGVCRGLCRGCGLRRPRPLPEARPARPCADTEPAHSNTVQRGNGGKRQAAPPAQP